MGDGERRAVSRGEEQRAVRPVRAVEEPGFWTTVQDLGRFGFQQYGVPPSGALDTYALWAANCLVGNEPAEAGLEITVIGPRLRAVSDCLVAVAGAQVELRHNGRRADTWQAHRLRAGDELRFAPPRRGRRAYLAVAGGIAVPAVLGSRSTYARGRLGALAGRALQPGDLLHAYESSQDRFQRAGYALPRELRRLGLPQPARVVLGPQHDFFAPAALQRLLGASFVVSRQADRMGVRLLGPALPRRRWEEMISEGVASGSIQVPADGRPIVLLADRQTTGGYPKIATVISSDLDFFAHVWAGDRVTFREISLEEAQRLRRRRRELLAEIARVTGVAAAWGG